MTRLEHQLSDHTHDASSGTADHDGSFEERWAAWQARGRLRELRLWRRLRVLGALVIVGAVSGAVWLVLR